MGAALWLLASKRKEITEAEIQRLRWVGLVWVQNHYPAEPKSAEPEKD